MFPKFDPQVSTMFVCFQTHLRKTPFCICRIAVTTPDIWKMLFLLTRPDLAYSSRNPVYPRREKGTSVKWPLPHWERFNNWSLSQGVGL